MKIEIVCRICLISQEFLGEIYFEVIFVYENSIFSRNLLYFSFKRRRLGKIVPKFRKAKTRNVHKNVVELQKIMTLVIILEL